jgi:hypothetical protein
VVSFPTVRCCDFDSLRLASGSLAASKLVYGSSSTVEIISMSIVFATRGCRSSITSLEASENLSSMLSHLPPRSNLVVSLVEHFFSSL